MNEQYCENTYGSFVCHVYIYPGSVRILSGDNNDWYVGYAPPQSDLLVTSGLVIEFLAIADYNLSTIAPSGNASLTNQFYLNPFNLGAGLLFDSALCMCGD
jgi:hypothetical protein